MRERLPRESHDATTPRVARRRPRSQHGFALVEVVVSLALIGTIVLALAGALQMLVNNSRSTSERQQIQLALTAMTENLLVGPYLPCPDDADAAAYDAAYASWPDRWTPTKPGMQARIVDVEYWDEQQLQGDGSERPDFGAQCPAIDQGAQRLTVEVSWQGRSATAQVVTTART